MSNVKSVSLREEQIKWIEQNHINFSSWVRAQLDEEMPKSKDA